VRICLYWAAQPLSVLGMETNTKHYATYTEEIAAITRKLDRIWRDLDREARQNYCPGDITSGWDWPTLRSTKPEVAAEIVSLKARGRECVAAMKTAGL